MGSVAKKGPMRTIGSPWVVFGCLFVVHVASALEDQTPQMKKLAEINVRLDASGLSGYSSVASPGSVLSGALVGYQNRTTGAVVVISGFDVIDSGQQEFHNDDQTKQQIEKQSKLMKQKSPKCTVDASGLSEINDYTYMWLQYTAPVPQNSSRSGVGHSTVFMTSRDGWTLNVFAVAPYASDARNAAEDVVHALRPLNPRGTQHPGTCEDYQGKVHGFASHLRDAGWQKWQRANELLPGNFVAARRGEGSYVIVMVLPLPEPGLSIEDHFAATMRTSTRFKNPEETFKITSIKMAAFDQALRFEGDTESNTSKSWFGGWFGQGAGRMMLTMAWSDKALVKDPKARVDSALACIEPLPITSPPTLSLFTRDQRQVQCNVLCEIASRLLRRGRNEDAVRVYGSALDCSHSEIATLELAVGGLQQIGDFSRAELLLSRYWKDFSDSPRAWLLRARLRQEAGKKDKAIEDYAATFRAGLRDEQAVLQYMGLLWEADSLEAALKFIEAYGKQYPSPRVTRWHAVTLARMKDYDGAFAIYATLIKSRPLDAEAVLQYGDFANVAGRHDLALQMVELLLKENQDGPRARLMEGWAHYGKKEWREAKLSFEAARKTAPNDSTVLAALNTANSALGEGDSSAVKQSIEPLSLPAEVQSRIDKAIAGFKHEDDESALELQHTTHIRFHKDKPTTTTVRRKIKILDTSGVDVFSTLDIGFDPLAERVFVNQLNVLDEDGKVIAHGKAEDQYVTDPSMDGPATLGRVLRVPVPGLKPGRTLDYVYTKRTLDKDKVMRFQSSWIGSAYPTAAQCVVVEGDLKDVRAVMNDTLKSSVQVIEDSDAGMRAWLASPAMQMHSEPMLPRFTTFSPVLWLGAPDAAWDKVGTDYLDLIKEQLKPEPDIEALAKKLVAGATTDEQKTDRLSRYVREEITYKAIEFGRRARIPNSPGRVTANHYGDCKDMALLLHHLLRAVGIESYLTLINSHMDLAPEFPDLDQFNHVILHVPALKAQFVDCTSGKSAGVNLPPSLFHLQALVLDPAKPHLTPMPSRKDWPASKLNDERVVRFDPEGSADVSDTLQFTSYLAQHMRMFLNSMPPPRRIDSMQSWLQRSSHWQLEKLEVVDLNDPARPLTLKLRYSIPPPAPSGSRSVKVPSIMEGEYLDINYLRHRHHPFEVLHPMEITSHVHVIAATPIDPASLRTLTRSNGENKYCTWSMKAAPVAHAGNECDLDFSAIWPASNGAAGEYTAMHRATAAAANIWEVPLHFTDEPKSAAVRR